MIYAESVLTEIVTLCLSDSKADLMSFDTQ